jgi:hypothetical protein
MFHADGKWLSKSTFIVPYDGLRTLIQTRTALRIKVSKATRYHFVWKCKPTHVSCITSANICCCLWKANGFRSLKSHTRISELYHVKKRREGVVNHYYTNCDCYGHTVHKLTQQRLTAYWLAQQESDCLRLRSMISSDWLPSYIKATRPVLEIFKMAGYFPDSPRILLCLNVYYAKCFGFNDVQ